MVEYSKVKRIFGLLSRAKQTENRADLILVCTGGRVSSVKDMTSEEAQLLIEKLENSLNIQPAPNEHKYVPDKRNKLRRKVISKMVEMWATNAAGKADMDFIYKFIEVKFKQQLNAMSMAELGKCIYVLENNWLPWFYKQKQVNDAFTIKQVSLKPKEVAK